MQRNKPKNARRSDANGISFPVSGLVGAAVVTLLCGCSASDPQKASHAAMPAQTVASRAAAPPGPIASVNNGGRDKTADFKTAKKNAPWLGKIKSVTETEPGKIRIETSLVDPRSADGSEEAKSAITICESVVSLFGPSYVSVLENDGTTFVLFGHPTVPSGACAEV